MKKVVIVGISSLVGSNLAVYLRKHYRVCGTYARYMPYIDNVPTFRLILQKGKPFAEAIMALKPDAVIYCAGLTDQQLCEKNPIEALYLNSEVPSRIAQIVTGYNSRFIYISSSKVFSGERGHYCESDEVDPVGVYGKSKYRAEEALVHYDNTFILRLGTVFGLGGYRQNSMLNRLLNGLWNGKPTALINDEWRSFISADEVAKAIGVLIDASHSKAGTYHMGGESKHSYYTFGLSVAGLLGLPTDLLKPVPGAHFQTAPGLRRGADLSLVSNHFCDIFKHRIPTFEQMLEDIANKLGEGKQ
ncbi:MAG: sugar nucleotide-binding protein [Deltaproteobacteria bacterium]|nr:sugar nucleotide-binding protein [Deltaproteobacteria bacterium]